MAISKAIRSESEYRSALKKVNANAMSLAELLSISGPIEQTLLDSVTTSKTNGSSSQEGRSSRRTSSAEEERRQNEMFLEEQRARLKTLVKRNISSVLNVDSFIGAVDAMKGEVETRQKRKRSDDDGGGSDDEAGEDPPNYEDMIQRKMEAAKQSQDQHGVEMKDHQLMKRYREKMGEKDDQTNEDEELEVINQSGGAESENAVLKCKMTLKRFVRPYKNKVCGHVYEHDAIMQYLRSKKACPMPGCSNQNVTKEQLEEDEEMRIKVRRKNRREVEEKMARDRERDELESDEGEDGGVTLID